MGYASLGGACLFHFGQQLQIQKAERIGWYYMFFRAQENYICSFYSRCPISTLETGCEKGKHELRAVSHASIVVGKFWGFWDLRFLANNFLWNKTNDCGIRIFLWFRLYQEVPARSGWLSLNSVQYITTSYGPTWVLSFRNGF